MNPHDIATSYLSLWNDADPDARRARLEREWTSDARYVDPMMSGAGRAGIASMIERARTQFPGHGFALRGTPDGHGGYVRFSWSLAPDGGAAVAGGTDVIRVDGDGRIAEVVGFLDAGAA